MSTSLNESPISPGNARGRGIGVMFLAFFGSWWVASGCSGMYGANIYLLSLVGAAGLSIFSLGLRAAKRNSAKCENREWWTRRKRAFIFLNLTQWAIIVALITALNATGHEEWAMPCIMLVVGLHFLPLAKLFTNRVHLITGTALVALALIYPFSASTGPSSALGPLCAGFILWGSAVVMLLEAVYRPGRIIMS